MLIVKGVTSAWKMGSRKHSSDGQNWLVQPWEHVRIYTIVSKIINKKHLRSHHNLSEMFHVKGITSAWKMESRKQFGDGQTWLIQPSNDPAKRTSEAELAQTMHTVCRRRKAFFASIIFFCFSSTSFCTSLWRKVWQWH